MSVVESIKQGNDNNISKQDTKQIFVSNAEQEIDANWKTYALAGIENPLPLIMQDLNSRADRLADNLTRDDEINSGYYQILTYLQLTKVITSLIQVAFGLQKPLLMMIIPIPINRNKKY